MDHMEFWGIEVKGKDVSKVKVEDHLLHLSQATLGEVKKDGEPVTLYVKVGEKKLALGVLNPKTNPQLSFDLVFEKDFEISHNWKNGSVHLMGYQSELPDDDEEITDFSDEDEDEELPVPTKANGDATVKELKVAAPKANAGKPKKDNKPKPEPKVEKDDDSDDNEDSDDEEMAEISDDSDDGSDDDEEESSEEETPVKVTDSGKKRKPELKTPEPKKAKVVATPQKTDGKKGAHTDTPHPAKKGGKTAPSGEKSTPKSGAQLACGSCKKTFNSEVGLQSHTKAKHSGGK